MEGRDSLSPSPRQKSRAMPTNKKDLASSQTFSLMNIKSGQLSNHLSTGSLNSDD